MRMGKIFCPSKICCYTACIINVFRSYNTILYPVEWADESVDAENISYIFLEAAHIFAGSIYSRETRIYSLVVSWAPQYPTWTMSSCCGLQVTIAPLLRVWLNTSRSPGIFRRLLHWLRSCWRMPQVLELGLVF